MQFKALALLAIQAITALAATNEPCYGPNSSPGVCVSTSACTKAGGTSHKNACPGNTKGSSPDPGSIQCCVKPQCRYSPSTTGACLWQSDCGSGKTVANQCPGPAGFKCCSQAKSVFGKYPTPSVPTARCAAVAERGGRTLMKAWPGRVRALGCYRCTDPKSDHCDGMAIDFMISDEGFQPTIGGREIAEWVMRNRKEMSLKYVIFGQRIWYNGNDKVVGWPAWRNLEDRGDTNANHWNHVHVSFK